MSINDNFSILFGLSIGAMALGFAMLFTSQTMLFDLDLFRYANNVTNMSPEIQESINQKQSEAELGQILSIIGVLASIIFLVKTFLVWRKIHKN
ncbi:MAG: hypothetical protein K5793_08950 [Nitrosarchaeum sp.]|nr:hypothetical protein [Nitrosarchaeum sp.]